MHIVIDIPKEMYEELKYLNVHGFTTATDEAIANGTPLPKGHGDLIDRRELKKDVYTTTEWNGDVHRIIYEASVDEAPTIIPADTGRENEE